MTLVGGFLAIATLRLVLMRHPARTLSGCKGRLKLSTGITADHRCLDAPRRKGAISRSSVDHVDRRRVSVALHPAAYCQNLFPYHKNQQKVYAYQPPQPSPVSARTDILCRRFVNRRFY